MPPRQLLTLASQFFEPVEKYTLSQNITLPWINQLYFTLSQCSGCKKHHGSNDEHGGCCNEFTCGMHLQIIILPPKLVCQQPPTADLPKMICLMQRRSSYNPTNRMEIEQSRNKLRSITAQTPLATVEEPLVHSNR